MPVLFKMSDDKKTEDTPAIVFAETQAAAPQRKTKKYVIIAVSGILAAVIILAAILVGMYIFTQAQKDIIQYTMQLSHNSKQDVTSDPNENVVQYHVSNPSHDAYIINDFNRDIQVVKVVNDGQTNCYVSALNRTNAMDPSKITGPDTAELKAAVSLMYRISDTPIVDTSFLGKTARDTCKGISVYWLYPYCGEGNVNKATNGTNVGRSKKRRSTHLMKKRQDEVETKFNNPPYYCRTTGDYRNEITGRTTKIPCVTGCCQEVCACKIDFYYWVCDGVIKCIWNIRNCPPEVDEIPVYHDKSCNGPAGLQCDADHDCDCPSKP